MKLRKILIIMIWLIGIAGILLLRIVGWMNRQVPIGRQALSMAGSELRIKIDPHNPSNHPRGFIAVIEYISGRQGPYATLTIYKQRELAPDSTYTQISNMEEIPVRIWPSSELKIRDQDLRPRREAWGPGIHQIRVAEDELFPTDAFISPMLDDHYIPQFFIYQGDDVNRRTDPIIAGSYMLRYDKSQQKWVLSKFGGFQAFLFIGSGIWKAQVTVLSAMLLLTVLLCQSRNHWKRTITEAFVLTAIMSFLCLFMPELFAMFILLLPVYPVARLIETLQKKKRNNETTSSQ